MSHISTMKSFYHLPSKTIACIGAIVCAIAGSSHADSVTYTFNGIDDSGLPFSFEFVIDDTDLNPSPIFGRYSTTSVTINRTDGTTIVNTSPLINYISVEDGDPAGDMVERLAFIGGSLAGQASIRFEADLSGSDDILADDGLPMAIDPNDFPTIYMNYLEPDPSDPTGSSFQITYGTLISVHVSSGGPTRKTPRISLQIFAFRSSPCPWKVSKVKNPTCAPIGREPSAIN